MWRYVQSVKSWLETESVFEDLVFFIVMYGFIMVC